MVGEDEGLETDPRRAVHYYNAFFVPIVLNNISMFSDFNVVEICGLGERMKSKDARTHNGWKEGEVGVRMLLGVSEAGRIRCGVGNGGSQTRAIELKCVVTVDNMAKTITGPSE
jgi:hypothetical protein